MTASADYLTTLLAALRPSPSPQEVVDALVPELADLVQMFVCASDELRLVAFRHIDPGHHPVLDELARVHRPPIVHPTDPVAEVMRTGVARLSAWVRREHVQQATSDARVHAIFDVIQPRSIVLVPLSRESRCYGALVIAMSSSRRQFMEGDLEFMVKLAKRVEPTIRLS